MAKPKTPFTEAAAQLWSDLGNRYWADITVDEAREYVDTDVIVAWIAQEAMNRDDNTICADTLADRLTSDQGRTLLCAVAIGHANKVLEVLKDAVVEQVARDLMYAANKLGEQYDPVDDEANASYSGWVDDPVVSDRRAMAGEVNSALRAARVSL